MITPQTQNQDRSSLSNQKGQFLVEAVLLLVVMMGISMALRQFFASSEFAKSLVSAPWSKLAGMIECGTWKGCTPGSHPSTSKRALTFDPTGGG
jgi:hypothetical protein